VEAASVDWGLTGKSVIVTGASSGIGASTARSLGAAGASVLLVGRDDARLAEQAEAVRSGGGKAEVAIVELEDLDATAGLAERAVAAFGSLHGIVHTASLFDPQPLADTSYESMERQWRTNVAAPLALTKGALPHLKEGASIVFIGSTTGSVGFPGCSAYTATKGAVNSVARAPGYVRTPMLQPHLDANEGYEEWILGRTPVARIGGPDEVSSSILFMLSPLSKYVDGATLVADGGWIAQ
jgi:NAD(P)-dependent dehydrogenase (short-subunit alcohol dehydrogenase family)